MSFLEDFNLEDGSQRKRKSGVGGDISRCLYNISILSVGFWVELLLLLLLLLFNKQKGTKVETGIILWSLSATKCITCWNVCDGAEFSSGKIEKVK